MATTSERGRSGRRRLAGAAFSLLVHAALLAALLASVRTLVLPQEPPPLEVELIRPDRPDPPESVRADAPQRPQTPFASPSPPTAAPRIAAAPPPSAPLPTPAPIPAAPAGSAAAPAAGPPARAARPAGADDDLAARVRSGLRRTVGCDDDAVIRLTPAERAACARRRAQNARGAPPPPLPADKLQAWGRKPPTRNAHAELRPDWDCGAGGSLGCRPPGMVGVTIPFGYVPKALPPIPPSTLHGEPPVKPPGD